MAPAWEAGGGVGRESSWKSAAFGIAHMRMVNSRDVGRFFSTKNGDFILDMISENG